jgi:hypothetical protein
LTYGRGRKPIKNLFLPCETFEVPHINERRKLNVKKENYDKASSGYYFIVVYYSIFVTILLLVLKFFFFTNKAMNHRCKDAKNNGFFEIKIRNTKWCSFVLGKLHHFAIIKKLNF